MLTTHTKLVNGLSLKNGFTGEFFDNRQYIVFDECPSDSLIDVQEMPLSEIANVLRYLKALDKTADGTKQTIQQLDEIVNTCESLLDGHAQELATSKNSRVYKPFYSELAISLCGSDALYTAVNCLKQSISSKVIDLLDKEHVVYTGFNDKFLFGVLKSLDVRNRHITILSATPHLPIITACFGEDNVTHEQSTLTELLAELYWVKTNKTSRSAMRDDLNTPGILSADWETKIKNIPSHTLAVCKEFKKQLNDLKSKFSSVVLTYPSAGLNAVKGKSLTAIGKYLESEQSLLMKAILIGARPATVARNNFVLETRDHIKYSTYTFVDETLRELEVVSYETAMRQTIGRARLLDFPITVFYISDRALPCSTTINYDEFIRRVHISVRDRSVTMSYQLTKEESNLFIDKYFGLRNEDGSLTEYGTLLLKKFNNDRKPILQYVTRATNNDIERA